MIFLCVNFKNINLNHLIYVVDCIRGNGRFYQGYVNVTKSGLPCQRWDSKIPHDFVRPPIVFPEVQNSENYCRNAGGEETSPWCYTMDPDVRWQKCNIPPCGKTEFNIKS
jgi:receptor tyrosine kinase